MRRRRLATAWRRLLPPPRPSPALERFLQWLAETPYRWDIGAAGKLRVHEEGGELCAITGVVRHRTGVRLGVGNWVRAADLIGLSYTDAGRVVEAADVARPAGLRMKRLRARLLAATRIVAAASTPPSRPDAMDRALADLVTEGAAAPEPPLTEAAASPSPRRSRPRA